MASNIPTGVNFVLQMNSKYVTVGDDGQLHTTESALTNASRFYFEFNPDGLKGYAVRCVESGRYVNRIPRPGSSTYWIRAVESNFIPSCCFLTNNIKPSVITLQCDNGHYWAADATGAVTTIPTFEDNPYNAQVMMVVFCD
jgi:hypothetical protein